MSEMAPKKEEITPEALFHQRRKFLRASIYAASALATSGLYRYFRGSGGTQNGNELLETAMGRESPTPLETISHYNNFYEFSTDKEAVAQAAQNWKIPEWSLSIGGLVEKPFSLSLAELRAMPAEERIYRFRCVEGWSMVIPWLGFPLQRLLERAAPQSNATYVALESYFSEREMPAARKAGIPFPYVEGLRLDEALHPLTMLAVGLYGKNLPNQNGAPVRLVVPWKYGFKSIKSVTKITLTDHEPPTTWNLANPREYGFYSNVNPAVDHPRWSQKQERRIGEYGLRETLPFNGYSEQVSQLYRGMDLRKDF